jgi:hypothetical protein
MSTSPIVVEIPLQPTPQKLGVTLNGVDYQLQVVWNDQNQSWIMDIMDSGSNPIAMGLPLVTADDLLEQFEYLGINGQMIVQTDFNATQVPTFFNLGNTSHLYFVSQPVTVPQGVQSFNQGTTPVPSGQPFLFNLIPFSTTPAFVGVQNTDMTFQITLSGNVTASTLSGLTAGAHVTFKIIQDATGSRAFAWPPNVLNAQTVGTAANEIDVQEFFFDGTNCYPTGPMTVN